MSKNLKIQLELSAKDNASNAVKAATKAVEKGLKNTGQAADQASKTTQKANQAVEHGLKATGKAAVESGKAQVQASQQAGKATQEQQRIIQQASTQMRSNAQALARARETLGVRSERVIQREILQSQLAYQRLARSGSASANELKRAWASHQQQLRTLNAEMGKMSFGQKINAVANGAMGLGAGVMAGAMTLREPMRQQMSFDRHLAMVANTAYSERDVAGRIAGKQALFSAVENAVKAGGGSKEEALTGLDTLLASGVVKAETAINLLPTLQKAAVGTGATTDDVAKIMISSMQQMGIKEADLGKALDMAVAAGQAGNFELKDMARWLPQQMAAGKQAGLDGMEGFQALLVANQQARVTAGTSDEAGNNLVNLLGKITSKETTERFKKLEYKDPKTGKIVGIDFAKSMEQYKSKGQDSLQAFSSIMDKVVGGNEDYKALQERIKHAKKEEQVALLNQMANLVEGTAIGEIISDRQALMALLGMRNNVKLGEEVKEKVEKSEGAVDTSHAVISQSNDAKLENAKNTAEFAEMKNMEKLNDVLGNTAELFTRYAQQYPELTQFLLGAKDAIVAFSAALVASSVMNSLSGGKFKLPTILGRGVGAATQATVASGASSAATAGASSAASRFAAGGVGKFAQGAGAVASRAAGVLALGGAVQFLGEARTEQEIRQEMKRESPEAKKENDAKAKFYQATFKTPSDSVWTKAGQQFVPKNAEPSKPTAPLYGGYALADIAQNQRLADIRRERGLISPDAYATRSLRNQLQIEDLKSPEKGLLNPYQRAGEDTRELIQGITSPMRQELLPSFEKFDQSLGDYRSEFGVFGSQMHDNFAQIGDSIQAMMNQNHTIENHISVNLDGRVVAENTSQHLFNFANRGVS